MLYNSGVMISKWFYEGIMKREGYSYVCMCIGVFVGICIFVYVCVVFI